MFIPRGHGVHELLGLVLRLRGRVLGRDGGGAVLAHAGLADVDGDALLGRLPAQSADQLLLALGLARGPWRRLLPLARRFLERINFVYFQT